MATSAAEGRGWVYERIARSSTPVILDVGPGEGTYSILGRHLRLDAKWIGLEIHEPYVERYHLEQKYDEIVIGNVLHVNWDKWPERPCTVLLGDIIEHLPHLDAVRLMHRIRRNACEVMVSIPIVESIQGCVDGNEHEAHLHQWSFEEMKNLLPGCETWRGDTVGRYWWRR